MAVLHEGVLTDLMELRAGVKMPIFGLFIVCFGIRAS